MLRDDIYRRVGTIEQLYGIKDYTLNSAKESGMRVIEVYNSKGLSFDILADRGMDIANLKYNGKNISFLSNTGLVSSKYFEEISSEGFMRNFYAGFLTTCGLSYMGEPCIDEGRELGLHGRISNTPSRITQIEVIEDNNIILVKGIVKESEVFGPHLTIERTITLNIDSNKFLIKDKVKNHGFERVPLMILYHMNIGYPFLDENLIIGLDSYDVVPRDEVSKLDIEKYLQVEAPKDGISEKVYFHQIKPYKGTGRISLFNKLLKFGLEISYLVDNLPYFTQWKSMRSGEYVMGFEPGNCNVLGRSKAKEKEILEYIEARETKEYSISVEIKE